MRLLTTGLVLTITLGAFESLAVATIMPIVAADLGGVTLYGWAFSAFFLASLIGIVVAGDLADHRGPALPYAAGLALFAIGLVIAGSAPTMLLLVAGRFVQGLGAGAIPAISYVTIGRAFPEHARPRMFAIFSTAWVVPSIVGPPAAAFIASALSWRAVFVVLLPFVALAAMLTLPALLRLGPPDTPAARQRVRDAVLVAAGAGLALAALSAGPIAVALVLAAIGLAMAVPAITRVTPPGTLLARPGLAAAVLTRGLLTFAFFTVESFLPLMLTEVRGVSTTLSGIVLTSGAVAWTAGSWFHARLATRLAGRTIIATGFALVVTGALGLLALLVWSLPFAVVFVCWAVTGVGMGFAYAAISLAVLRLAPSGAEGASSSAMQVLDNLGTGLGAGIGGAAVAVAIGNGLPLATGIGAAFAIGIAGGAIGIAVSRRLEAGRGSAGVVGALSAEARHPAAMP
ncbi:MAG TPA: MFS transporter [Candidatus Limnocylindria bacterium]